MENLQLQSQKNAINARIEQYRNSELFTPEQKAKRIAEAEKELELLISKSEVLGFKNEENSFAWKDGTTDKDGIFTKNIDYENFPSD